MNFYTGIALFIFNTFLFSGSITGIIELYTNRLPAGRDEKINKWTTTTYNLTNNTIIPNKCCKKDLCECKEINNGSICSSMLNNQTLGYCNNGAQCCVICLYCQPQCISYVDKQRCSIICGTCNTIITYFSYNINNTLYVTFIKNYCDQDNQACMNYVSEKYSNNFTGTLWYEKLNSSNFVYEKPKYHYSPPAHFYGEIIVYLGILDLSLFIFLCLYENCKIAIFLYNVLSETQSIYWFLFVKALKNNGINNQSIVNVFYNRNINEITINELIVCNTPKNENPLEQKTNIEIKEIHEFKPKIINMINLRQKYYDEISPKGCGVLIGVGSIYAMPAALIMACLSITFLGKN
jgi:hypothetical protein